MSGLRLCLVPPARLRKNRPSGLQTPIPDRRQGTYVIDLVGSSGHGGIGRRKGLKIPRRASAVPVRPRLPAPRKLRGGSRRAPRPRALIPRQFLSAPAPPASHLESSLVQRSIGV